MVFIGNYEYSGDLGDNKSCLSENYENNISKHIFLGEKLRKIKSKTCRAVKEYRVIDIIPHKDKNQTANFVNSNNKKRKNIDKKPRSNLGQKEKCPLRIIELAYPSKRHCLETWKIRNKTLPIYMIERLRQIINDEKPKAPLRDAINFLKKTKTKRRKCDRKHFCNDKKRQQLILLCGIFGYKIMDILERPINIELNPELSKIAYMIDKDISTMLYNPKNRLSVNDDEFLNNIIKKIAVWIDGILEESSHNLFLEDLRELEEKEGPVLDLLEEVFYRASGSTSTFHCIDDERDSDNTEEYNEDEPIYIKTHLKKSDDRSNDESLKYVKIPHIDNDDNASNKVRPEQELMEDIFFNAMDHELSHTMDVSQLDEPIPADEEHLDKKSSKLQSTDFKNNDLNQLKDYINLILMQIIEEAYEKYLNKIHGNSQQTAMESTNDNDSQNSDESEVEYVKMFKNTRDSLVIHNAHDSDHKSEINLRKTVNYSEEDKSLETSEDGNRKVKFTHNDFDNIMELAKTKASELDTKNNLPSVSKTKSVKIPNENNSKTIYLSDPSPFLLTEADESWPESTSVHSAKSLLQVSKSVMSLGELIEKEEEILLQSHYDDKGNEMQSSEVNASSSSNKQVVRESNVSNLINKDNKNKIQNLKTEIVRKNEKSTSKNLLEELNKIKENKDSVIEGEKFKSSLIIPDETSIFMNKLSQNKNALTIKKLPNLNIIQNYNKSLKIGLGTSRRTQFSPELSNKSTATDIETDNIPSTVSERGYNDSEDIKYEEWCKGLDNIVHYLEIWLYWIRIITAQVESLHKKEFRGVNWCKLKYNQAFNLKAWICQSRDLQKRLASIKCSYNHLKKMPYKCYCNKKLHNRENPKRFF